MLPLLPVSGSAVTISADVSASPQKFVLVSTLLCLSEKEPALGSIAVTRMDKCCPCFVQSQTDLALLSGAALEEPPACAVT